MLQGILFFHQHYSLLMFLVVDWMSENPQMLYGLGVQAVHTMFYCELHLHESISYTESEI